MVTVRKTVWIYAALFAGSIAFGATKPQIVSFHPAAVNVGTFSVAITGMNFAPGAVVSLDGVAVPSTFISPTQLSFTATVDLANNYSVTVTNPAPNAAISTAKTLKVMPPIAVNVHPHTMVTLRAATGHKFAVTVSNAVDPSVTWLVNGIVGGNATLGTIAADGTYSAPAVPPSPNVLQVQARSKAAPAAVDSVALTLINAVPVITSVNPKPLPVSKTSSFTVNGTGFVTGAVVKRAGVALTTNVVSNTQLSVTGEVPASIGGVTAITVSNPNPGAATSKVTVVPVGPPNPQLSYLAAARFLEQASWGPDPVSVAHLQAIGINAWLAEQFAAPMSTYANHGSGGLDKNQSEFFVNAMTKPDQLRQRVAFALSQIFVISGLKTPESRQFAPYLNMLSADAFGNYRAILKDVTLSPAMGVYLDMVNNDKADPTTGTAPNENYAREVLQLFSIGLVPLNPDGSAAPGVTYDQNTITNLARAFTGWTYPSAHGAPAHGHNPENFSGPMVPVAANHDTGAKTVLGKLFPAGQTASQDLDTAMDAIAQHPNVGPFISLRLIEHLVTSNPSPAYLSRVIAKFNNNGSNVRGDLQAVVTAILTDPEARQGDNVNDPAIAGGGHLREPILFLLNLIRAMDASVVVNNPLESAGSDMGQKLFYSPSVFNYYSPLYRIPGGLLGPEFQTLSPATSLARANTVYNFMASGLDRDVRFSTSLLAELASDPAELVDVLNTALLYGRLPLALRADIITALGATTDRNDRVKTALYLIASSPLYQVEH